MKSKLEILELVNTVFDAVNESRVGPVFIDVERKNSSLLAVNLITTMTNELIKEKE